MTPRCAAWTNAAPSSRPCPTAATAACRPHSIKVGTVGQPLPGVKVKVEDDGELLIGMMCESVEARKTLPAILKEVPGIQLVIVGEGDLSQNLGVPRQYDHPKAVAAIDEIVAICKGHNVVCGHPHAGLDNIEAIIKAGYRWVMAGPTPSFAALKRGRELTK